MTRLRANVVMLSMLWALLSGAPVAQDLDVALRAAMETETVKGDLKGAIEQYKTVAASNDRSVAAKALLRMAECYQKLGDAESRAVYEKVVREYADQKDAVVVARARLGNVQSSAARAIGDRLVWAGRKVDMFGQVSPDGRYITYVDWGGDQNLIVHDNVTGTDRPLTVTGPSVGFSQYAEFSTISRDGSQVAYAWYNDKGRYELRILPLQAGAGTQPKRVFPGDDDIKGVSPRDWSPDGKTIVVNLRRADGTRQIGLVAVADGSLRVLKSVDWRGAENIAFSPDGRFIAYDVPADESDTQRNLYVMAVNGSSESVLAPHPSRNVLMAWARDGYVVFASDRGGQPALWGQAVAAGKPQGTPTLIKRDVGFWWPLGLTNTGSLYVFKGPSANYVQVVGVDLVDHKFLAPSAGSFQQYIGSGGFPTWSRDGKSLAYTSCPIAGRAACRIVITSIDSGHTREIHPKFSYLGVINWSADGKSFLTDGTDLKGRRALYRIDAQTGDLQFVHARLGAISQWAPDERKFYYRRGGSIIEQDLSTNTEREVFRERAKGNSVSIKVSPDGRTIAAVETAGPIQTLYLIQIAGGNPVELLRTKSPEGMNGFRLHWTPDSRALVIPKRRGPDLPNDYWLVPIDGRAPRQLDLPTGHPMLETLDFAIHPDGRQLAFAAAAGKRDPEVWALENFLPVTKP
jgi:Tol biopolymer transport system component